MDYEKGNIETKEFKKEHQRLESWIKDLTLKKIDELESKINNREQKINKEQKELEQKIEKQKKLNRRNAGRKQNPNSYSSLILKALMNSSLDDEDKVVSMVKHWKDNDVNKIRVQVRNIVSVIKKGKEKRYENYKFDSDKYLVMKDE